MCVTLVIVICSGEIFCCVLRCKICEVVRFLLGFTVVDVVHCSEICCCVTLVTVGCSCEVCCCVVTFVCSGEIFVVRWKMLCVSVRFIFVC